MVTNLSCYNVAMPKKRTQKTAKKHNQVGSHGLKVWVNRHKKDKWLPVVFALLLLLSPFAYKQVKIYQEKQMYVAAEQEISKLASEAVKIGSSTKKSYRDCSSSSFKFDEKTVSCTIGADIEYKNMVDEEIARVISQTRELEAKSTFDFAYDNTKQNKDSPYMISVRVYKFRELSCVFDQHYAVLEPSGSRFDKTTLIFGISCEGAALKEYY